MVIGKGLIQSARIFCLGLNVTVAPAFRFGVWTPRCHFPDRDFFTVLIALKNANLLIGNGSSTCLETLAKAIPVIVVGSRHELIHNPIPVFITDDIWCLCYSPEEIVTAFSFIKTVVLIELAA